MASKLARHLVSKQKKRFVEQGFDLDLSYITEIIIAMGIPSEGTEGLFRNPMSEVTRFFNTFHKDVAKVYNLCIEDTRQYDPEQFSGQVGSFPFYDHNCPPLYLVPAFCRSAYEWLKSGPENVIAVHCKAGKSRTGLMICCLLLHLNEAEDPDECIKFYGRQRTNDGKGVTIASQHRYIHYYRTILDNGHYYPKLRKMRLLRVRVLDLPTKLYGGAGGSSIQFDITDHSCAAKGAVPLLESVDERIAQSLSGEAVEGAEAWAEPDSVHASFDFSACAFDVNEDFRLTFKAVDKNGNRSKLFYCWINTAFLLEPEAEAEAEAEEGAEPEPEAGAAAGQANLKPVQMVMYRTQLDKFGDKKKYPLSFRVELTLQDLEARPQTAEEQRFRKAKQRYDSWVLEQATLQQDAAKAKRDKKQKKDKKGGEDASFLSPEEIATKEATRRLLEARFSPVALGRVLSVAISYVEQAIVNANAELSMVENEQEWGTYVLDGLALADVSMGPNSNVDLDLTDGGIRIRIDDMSAAAVGFDWKCEKPQGAKEKAQAGGVGALTRERSSSLGTPGSLRGTVTAGAKGAAPVGEASAKFSSISAEVFLECTSKPDEGLGEGEEALQVLDAQVKVSVPPSAVEVEEVLEEGGGASSSKALSRLALTIGNTVETGLQEMADEKLDELLARVRAVVTPGSIG